MPHVPVATDGIGSATTVGCGAGEDTGRLEVVTGAATGAGADPHDSLSRATPHTSEAVMTWPTAVFGQKLL